ncbi:hypothetical protein MWN34_01750 [Ancylobacter sp. 6x-1]|uniref:DUF1772 domain-containing protein n=1 Tax=Ancylobacter crimeensis TaxID=2579147 RepID=A0ABT0D6Q1_9HYPH|nr:hypothetical protein [Ancylobacter crimeensis]MCK0195628.1 hypothetical protein [Ancylobacter crimeensis]
MGLDTGGFTFLAAATALFTLIGLLEWFVLPSFMERSIRSSREGRRLPREQLDGIVRWWKTVIRVVAVSMPLVGFGLASLAD